MTYCPIQPYSDELMTWNEVDEMYYLTEEALIKRGIPLRSRLALSKASSPEYIINGLLETVSEMIYNYIHDFSANNKAQDCLIATVPSLRKIIYKALIQQAVYVLKVGNLSLSVEDSIRSKSIDMNAVRTLNTVVHELGIPITYTGV